ncbi:10972_t:CDS:2 [Funneliformis caledonium]|uniref:10972_t:CDS:1 n=1 Tax=Funneliformis caledonium TaxID=1117310 RepID=A0A9N9EKZ9_9GLOM|nr:10972_t:CDS:2 [Funneliformis caledonium]
MLQDETNNPTFAFIDSDWFDSDEEEEDPICKTFRPLISLEEGIKAHNEKKYEIAWECFKNQSEIDNPKAKYWKAHYLYNEINVSKDVDEAIKLYKEAADEDVTEASFQYAMCILHHHGNNFNRQDYERYLRKAADRKHINAQFHLAEFYIHGNFGIEKNLEEGT